MSFAVTQRLIDAGTDLQSGPVGEGYDNALAETTVGLYKTELSNRRGPWETLDQVELATLGVSQLVQPRTTSQRPQRSRPWSLSTRGGDTK
jgi:transposase InsO family protein